jgi:AcrR family transcriptional regulator
MAKLKSEDKRNALLTAATQVFAEHGLGAPTSAITKAAGVAEGTLFTYFRTKDDLVNALYRDIKLDMADAMMSGFPRKTSVRHRLQHIWNHYVDWGVANPASHRVRRPRGPHRFWRFRRWPMKQERNGSFRICRNLFWLPR